jgi:hypothetical protein
MNGRRIFELLQFIGGGDSPGAADHFELQSVFIVFPVHDPIGFFARQKVDWRPTARSFAFGRHIEVELVLAGFDFAAKLRFRVKFCRDLRWVMH